MDIIGAPSATKGGSLVASDVMVVLGIILAVVAVLALGIFLGWKVSRSRREERNRQIQGLHGSSRRSSSSNGNGNGSSSSSGGGGDEGGSGKRRVRRRRRDHRPRNPTLAEAGGLPPERTDTGRSASETSEGR